jgi:hypothetical protein
MFPYTVVLSDEGKSVRGLLVTLIAVLVLGIAVGGYIGFRATRSSTCVTTGDNTGRSTILGGTKTTTCN